MYSMRMGCKPDTHLRRTVGDGPGPEGLRLRKSCIDVLYCCIVMALLINKCCTERGDGVYSLIFVISDKHSGR